MKYGWRLLNRPARDRWKVVLRVRANESGWQHSIHETHTSELSDDQHDHDNNIDHMQQPDTDIPSDWQADGSGESGQRQLDITSMNGLTKQTSTSKVPRLRLQGGATTSSRVRATRPMPEVVLSCSSTMLSNGMRSMRWPRAKMSTDVTCVEPATSAWRSFSLRWRVRPPPGLRVKGALWHSVFRETCC